MAVHIALYYKLLPTSSHYLDKIVLKVPICLHQSGLGKALRKDLGVRIQGTDAAGRFKGLSGGLTAMMQGVLLFDSRRMEMAGYAIIKS